LSAQQFIHITPHAHNGNPLKRFSLNPPRSEITRKAKLAAQKILFRIALELPNELANERSTNVFRSKHCSPTGDSRAKGESKGNSRDLSIYQRGFTKEAQNVQNQIV
jgi:hypothetical protein